MNVNDIFYLEDLNKKNIQSNILKKKFRKIFMHLNFFS